MRATPGRLPSGPGWAFEMRWPGPRLLVDVTTAATVVFETAAGRVVTTSYPELVAMSGDLDDVLLDGVLLAVGEEPSRFVAVDMLRLYGVDLRARPYTDRRRTLERLAGARPTITLSPSFDDAAATVAAAREHELSGVIAKRQDSPYRGGMRPEWVEEMVA